MDEEVKERLAKIISNRGICSRRDAEKLILAGKVKVKGQLWTSLSEKVSPRAPLEISGESIPAPDHSFNPRLWLMRWRPGSLPTIQRRRSKQAWPEIAIEKTESAASNK